jgi:hypothetical protein
VKLAVLHHLHIRKVSSSRAVIAVAVIVVLQSQACGAVVVLHRAQHITTSHKRTLSLNGSMHKVRVLAEGILQYGKQRAPLMNVEH